MDAGDAFALVVTLVITVGSVAISIVASVLSLLIPFLVIGGVVLLLVRSSRNVQLAGAGVRFVDLGGAGRITPPRANRLKKVVCRTCGGSKVLPPKTAYVYCDFCGTLVDWDFQIACSRGSALPGPAYEQLQAREKPLQDAAKAKGDHDAYAASIRRVFDAHFTACPSAWSPRLGDPRYREAMLANTVKQYTIAAFDDECVRLDVQMAGAVRGLQWIYGGTPKVSAASFEPLIDAVLAHSGRFIALGEPFLHEHPDEPTADLQRRVARSAFAQGWLAYLPKADQDRLIARMDLGGDYVDLPTVETSERRCGGCARTVRVAPGARKVVCEDCGHTLDVSRPEIACSGCGGPITVLFSMRSFRCPHCSMELRLD